MAFHVDCYKRAKGKKPKTSTPSKYESTCAFQSDGKCLHNGKIAVGDMISWARRGYYANGTNGASSNGSAPREPAEETEEETSKAVEETAKESNGTTDPVARALAAILLPLVEGKIQEKLGKLDPDKLVAEADALIKAKIDSLSMPREVVVKSPAIPDGVNVGVQHKQFDLLTKIRFENPLLVGPSGSGKTTAAKMLAKALGLEFSYTGAVTDAALLFGYCDAMSRYVTTPFRKVWQNGGVFLWDEVDGSDPNAFISFNAALSNHVAAFPDGMVERHPDAVIIAAANTFGRGATREYVGRNKLDEASLKRFSFLEWEYDEELEESTCIDKAWCRYVQKVRAKVQAKGLRVLVTGHDVHRGARLLAAGLEKAQVAKMTMFAGVSAEIVSQLD